MPTLPPIKGFLETSFSDWTGRVAAVLFLPRCNFRCPYCHNHALVLDPERYETLSPDWVLERLAGFRDWLDGVCISGGEPTLHAGLGELVALLRRAGWRVKLDTNGSRPEVLARLLEAGQLDFVALDVKAPLEAIPYRRNAGVGVEWQRVAESLDALACSGVPYELRTTVHPDLLSVAELERLGTELGRRCGAAAGEREVPRWVLQRCRGQDALESALRSQPDQDAEAFAAWQGLAERCFAAGVRGGA